MKNYLAYGSNLNMMQMAVRCPGAVPIGVAVIKGYRLMYKGSLTGAYLTIEKAKGYFVPVGVWRVSASDERELDRYEGYPHFYYKKEFMPEVTTMEGEIKRMKCFCYIMHEDRQLANPSINYLRTCLQGYEDFGFDKRLLIEAISYSNQRSE